MNIKSDKETETDYEFTVPVALDKNNSLVARTDAKKGEDYYCPNCRKNLIFRKGDVRIPHFAHKADTICSPETVLHKTAKLLVATAVINWRKNISPTPEIKRQCAECDSAIYSPLPQNVLGGAEEFRLSNGRIIDVALLDHAGIPQLAIEICVTHAVDESKAADLTLPWIEVMAEAIIANPNKWDWVRQKGLRPFTCLQCKTKAEKRRREIAERERREALLRAQRAKEIVEMEKRDAIRRAKQVIEDEKRNIEIANMKEKRRPFEEHKKACVALCDIFRTTERDKNPAELSIVAELLHKIDDLARQCKEIDGSELDSAEKALRTVKKIRNDLIEKETFRKMKTHNIEDLAKSLGVTLPPSPPYFFDSIFCWRCKKEIVVYTWDGRSDWATESPPEPIPKTIQNKYSKTINKKYWANTCHYCHVIQGDFFLYNGSDAPFRNFMGRKMDPTTELLNHLFDINRAK